MNQCNSKFKVFENNWLFTVWPMLSVYEINMKGLSGPQQILIISKQDY